MAEFPALPLWTDAYIGDTAHLTNEEHGVYLRLLMFAWRSPACALPDDDKRLALMVGVTPKKWASLRPVIAEFWNIGDGTWTQKRLTAERDFVQGQSEKNRAAAEARWKRNALKNNNLADASAMPAHMPNGCVTDAPIPTPISSSLRSEDYGGGVVAQAPDREADARPTQDLIWRILHAIGLDRGQTIPRFWMAPDAPVIVSRWRTELGLSDDEIVGIAAQNGRQFGEPARGPKILTQAMANYAAAKSDPMPQPQNEQRKARSHDRQSEQRAFDASINRLADGIAAGTVHIDASGGDPWEYARRNGAG